METKEILDFLREAEEKGIIESKSLESVKQFKLDLEKLFQAVPGDTKEIVIQLDDELIELLKNVRLDFFKLGIIYSSMKR